MMNFFTSRMTPYDKAYPTCERTNVSLRIYAEQLDPAIISTRLRLQPTIKQSKGEKFTNRLGRQREAKINGWFLESEGFVNSKDVRDHLDWLLAKLEHSSDELKLIQMEGEGIKMAIHCIWWSAIGHGGPTLWPEQMKKMAEMNLECTFDINFYGNDE